MRIDLTDIRDYVFPLFVGDDPARLSLEQPIKLESIDFLGTGFFIAKNGVALTAGHCVPPPESIPTGKAFLAIVWDGSRPRAAHVQLAMVVADRDIGILKIAFSPSKYLPISFEQVDMGEDVSTVGIPSHSVSGTSKEFRCLKGNVTFVSKLLELSFPAPRGMSGSPVFRGAKVVGVLSWNARAEALEDQTEETTEEIGNITRVTKTVTKAVTNYGLAEPLHAIKDSVYSISEGAPFEEFIAGLAESVRVDTPMPYGVKAKDHLTRARVRLDENAQESLFYAALEIRCGIEARLKEYFDAQAETTKKKRQGWQIAKLAKQVESVFKARNKAIRLIVFDAATKELIKEVLYTPVTRRLQKMGGKLGDYLHSKTSIACPRKLGRWPFVGSLRSPLTSCVSLHPVASWPLRWNIRATQVNPFSVWTAISVISFLLAGESGFASSTMKLPMSNWELLTFACGGRADQRGRALLASCRRAADGTR